MQSYDSLIYDTFLLYVLFVTWIVVAIFTCWLAVQKRRNGLVWLILGLLCGVIAFLAVGMAPKKVPRPQDTDPDANFWDRMADRIADG